MKNVMRLLGLSVSLLSACAESEPAPSDPFPVCEARPTTRIALQGNLDATVEPTGYPNFVFSIVIIDGAGLPLRAQIEFTNTGSLSWTYRVWGRDITIGSGALDFSEEGRLASHKVVQALHAPELNGTLDPAVTLFLGSSLDQGGNGLDGITDYAAASSITKSTVDGLDSAVANACTEAAQQPSPQHRDPETGACPGHPTTEIRLRGNLNAAIPSSPHILDLDHMLESSDFSYPMLAYGPDGVPVATTFFFVKSSINLWVFHVAVGWKTFTRLLTTGTLEFSEDGSLLHRKDFSALRIPDGHGQLGPPVILDLGSPQDLGADGLSGLTGLAASTTIISAQVDGNPPVVGGFCD